MISFNVGNLVILLTTKRIRPFKNLVIFLFITLTNYHNGQCAEQRMYLDSVFVLSYCSYLWRKAPRQVRILVLKNRDFFADSVYAFKCGTTFPDGGQNATKVFLLWEWNY